MMYSIPRLGQTRLVKNVNGNIFRINFNRNCVHQSAISTYHPLSYTLKKDIWEKYKVNKYQMISNFNSGPNPLTVCMN